MRTDHQPCESEDYDPTPAPIVASGMASAVIVSVCAFLALAAIIVAWAMN